MRHTRTLTAIALAMGLAAPAAALAQEDEAALGEITQEEWTSFGDESFAAVDADGDGAVTEEEYNEWARTNWGGLPGGGDADGPLFGLLDVNDDAQVAEDEWFGEESFTQLDDDGSGVLEDDEFLVGGEEEEAAVGAEEEEQAAVGAGEVGREVFAAADVDASGDISEEEWAAYGEQTFAEADVDQSGAIDEEESQGWFGAFGGGPGGGDAEGPLWGWFDITPDQQLTQEEWFGEESFGELDRDESGTLTEEELGA